MAPVANAMSTLIAPLKTTGKAIGSFTQCRLFSVLLLLLFIRTNSTYIYANPAGHFPPSSLIWTGSIDTDWATAGNWSTANVPTASDDVRIPNTSNAPIIDGLTAAAAKSVVVEFNAQLTISASGSLTIGGAEFIALDCNLPQASVLEFGASNTFTVATTWYKDQAQTETAGSYDQISNTFSPTDAPTAPSTLYFTISGGGCSHDVAINYSAQAVDDTTPATWIGLSSSDWTEPCNWSTGLVPGDNTRVVIAAGDNNCQIPAGENVSANSVAIEVGASLTVDLTGALTLVGDTISIENFGTLTNNGELDIESDELGLSVEIGEFINGPTGTIEAEERIAGVNEDGGVFQNNGDLLASSYFNAIAVRIVNGPATNDGSILINKADGDAIAISTNGSLTNRATINIGQSDDVEDDIEDHGIDNRGVFSPGFSPGTLSFTNDLDFSENSILIIEVQGTTSNAFDQILGGGNINISDATLNATITYSPTDGDRIVILNANTISGTFQDINPALPAGWFVDYTVAGEVALVFNAALPVELVYFAASKIAEVVLLEWQTASESNNRGFDMLHSIDGLDWRNIGFVAGNVNAQESNSYAFTHSKPVIGDNYYRLRQLDFDGQYSDSAIRTVKFDGTTAGFELQVYPNPAADFAQIRLPASDPQGRLAVTNTSGYTIYSTVIVAEQEQIQLDLQDWSVGTYLIHLQLGQSTTTLKLIRTKT
ncbi:MAG: T9SS type A sorting domain-containing protein [Bacteroidota bacterium]